MIKEILDLTKAGYNVGFRKCEHCLGIKIIVVKDDKKLDHLVIADRCFNYEIDEDAAVFFMIDLMESINKI